MSSVIYFLDKYSTYLQHTVDMVNEITFKWCLQNPIDVTIINHIDMSIKRDQPIFNKICKALDEQKRMTKLVVCVMSMKLTNN